MVNLKYSFIIFAPCVSQPPKIKVGRLLQSHSPKARLVAYAVTKIINEYLILNILKIVEKRERKGS